MTRMTITTDAAGGCEIRIEGDLAATALGDLDRALGEVPPGGTRTLNLAGVRSLDEAARLDASRLMNGMLSESAKLVERVENACRE